jgi:hypothetical protein
LTAPVKFPAEISIVRLGALWYIHGNFKGIREVPMSRVYRWMAALSWTLGVLSLAVGVVFRLAPALSARTTFTPRGGFILAGVLFLCALATAEIHRAGSSGS